MTISIIIPAFNSENSIAESLQSCMQQRIPKGVSIEIVLVDDGSTDGTRDIATRFSKIDTRVRIIALPHNMGTFAARINGILEAKGDFVIFLDSDDRLLPDCVEQFVQTINGMDADVVFANRITHNAHTQNITRSFTHLPSFHILKKQHIFAEVFAIKTWNAARWTQTAKLFKRDVLLDAVSFIKQELGEIPQGISNCEDMLFSFAIFTFAQKALVVDYVTYEYLYRNRDQKIRTVLYPNHDLMYGIRIIDYLQSLTSAVSSLDIYPYAKILVAYLKCIYYDSMRHGSVFINLDRRSQTGLISVYIRAVAWSFVYGRRWRAIKRLLLNVLSFGRIKP